MYVEKNRSSFKTFFRQIQVLSQHLENKKDFQSSQIKPILYHCTDNKVVETSLEKIRVGNFLGNGQHLYLHIPVLFLPQIELILRKKKNQLKTT